MIAFDTNILVYYFDERYPDKQAVARRLVAQTTDGVTIWQVACEFIAATRKLYGFTTEDAWDSLEDYLTVLPLVVPGPGALAIARELQLRHRVAFWDAVMLGSCKEAGVARVYSEDLPGSLLPDLEVVNPSATGAQ